MQYLLGIGTIIIFTYTVTHKTSLYYNIYLHFIYRVKELQSNGMSKFVFDPDRDTTMRILQEHMQKNKTIGEPQIADWTPSLDVLPQSYSYLSIVEYLIKRQVAIIDAKGETLSAPIMLPTADKPLVKGHNFFASGNVGEVMLNRVACGAIHIRCDVLASMRDIRYDVKCVIDGESSLVHHASCQCPAGAGGKCNHVAAVLFAMLDYVTVMRNPDSCTNKAQVWHRPKRATKRTTKPLVVGKRKVEKHLFSRTVTRKRPLEGYKDYRPIDRPVAPDTERLLSDVKQLEADHHSMGLRQILDDSTDSATSDDAGDTVTPGVSFTPEEIVSRRLQVTAEEQRDIEQETIGQHQNVKWFKERCGRLTASKAKRYCGKGNPSLMLRSILSSAATMTRTTGHMSYGIENEDAAVVKYVDAATVSLSIRECGLFVDTQNGQLAASPDRIATIDGEELVIEVKCLSSCRTMSPLDAIKLKQGESGFAFKLVNNGVSLKDKHPYYYQVQMQMGVTGLTQCHLIIFTSPEHDICTCEIAFDNLFWENMKAKLLDFHASFVIPALVNQMCR